MISSKEILKKTGIKSIKTLTRWHQSGYIPKPLIGTHPSGHGKLGYWPDWVLKRCLKMMELIKQGHLPRSAAALLDRDAKKRRGCCPKAATSDFGKRLEVLLQGQTLIGFEEKCGLPRGSLTYYMQGRKPTLDVLEKITIANNCNGHWLITGEGHPLLGVENERRR